ncbi:LOW QUALITY PROTEIN: uncharacterized protein LOC117586398 [Drosophila guanche]|uniref:LOW QUALITY PROTEIN: uncharacterized protein LOC117586398 n=1 Tax=Drosophila guanche TaxID=7266 RepID=UPI0014709973|nr:LOW QUALITY PROTEIN: uncharacterized protein LOC117586398 [Drosophila guanche]
MIRKQFKLLFVFDATTTSNQEPPTCLPNGSKSNWPTKNWETEKGPERRESRAEPSRAGQRQCNEHTSWTTVAFGRWDTTGSTIDGSPKTI